MLSPASVLLYWSARFGEIPVIGGYPGNTRNTAGKVVDRAGKLISALPNSPRFGWDTINGERRQTLVLEPARTNNLFYSSDFSNGVWTKTNCSVTTGVKDPMGGTNACTITATAANATATQDLGAGSSIVRTNSMWLRRRSGSGVVQLLKPDLTGTTITLTDQWQRFTVVGAAGTTRKAGIYIQTSGDAVDVCLAQQEDAAFATSAIETTSPVTRATDNFYFDYQPSPQAMMAYCRFVEAGSIANPNSAVWEITGPTHVVPSLFVARGSAGYFADHGTTVNEYATSALTAPAVGDLVELVLILFANGSMRLDQSINGGAVSSSSVSTALALAAAWSGPRLWLNSLGPTDYIGSNRFAEMKFVKYADVVGSSATDIMAELRAFELDGQGNQI